MYTRDASLPPTALPAATHALPPLPPLPPVSPLPPIGVGGSGGSGGGVDPRLKHRPRLLPGVVC